MINRVRGTIVVYMLPHCASPEAPPLPANRPALLISPLQTSAPLVEGLKSPAMRPRHWKQVLRYASTGHTILLGRGGAFDPALLGEMTFGQLLDLELHCELFNCCLCMFLMSCSLYRSQR